MLVRMAGRFQETLRPRERANFDVEDVLQELWVKLATKDYKFDPSRGRYSSFAGAVAQKHMERVRDATRTVRPPGNSSARVREYEQKRDGGGLEAGERETYERLLSVLDHQVALASFDGEDDGGGRPDSAVVKREEDGEVATQTVLALCSLEPEEAAVVGELAGLWGQEPMRLSQVAARRHRSVQAIREIAESATIKFERAATECRRRKQARESHPARRAS